MRFNFSKRCSISALMPCLTYAYAVAAATPLTHRVIQALAPDTCITADVKFTVTMPQLNDDVIYELSLTQTPASGDASLLPYDYIIDWTLTGKDIPVKGFSAYCSGHHYRYSNERLQEYHMDWDSIPFISVNGSGGVQRQAQFANLLPAAIGADIERMKHDNRYSLAEYPDTVVSGIRRAAIKAVMTIGGETAMEGEYIFDRATLMPARIILENNPGALCEQTVTAEYNTVTAADTPCQPIDESTLTGLYPDIFEKYRECNFRIENLPGTRLPGFALPTSTGERYTRHISDGFRAPTVIALMNASAVFSSELVQAVRDAIDSLPYSADVIWCMTDHDIDSIEAVIPSLRPGEHLLTSSSSLARDCGAASLPTLILADTDGTVRDVILGYNKELSQLVIQKMALIQP